MSLTPEERAKYEKELREHKERLAASSALPAPESAGPVSSFALDRGSLPVSSAEILELCNSWDLESCGRPEPIDGTLRSCAKELRRLVVDANKRQPEENSVIRLH